MPGTDLETLAQFARSASIAVSRLEAERRAERRTRLEAFTSELDKELSTRFDEQIGIARDAKAAADKALDDARESAALNSSLARFVGTKMEEVEARYSNVTYKTGAQGVIDIWTASSPRPANMPSYRTPQIGTLVIRLLKKDGTPSVKHVPRHRTHFWRSLDGRTIQQLLQGNKLNSDDQSSHDSL